MVFGCLFSVEVFCAVLPVFLLHCVALFPRELSEKILLFLGLHFEKIFGSKLLVFGCLCSVQVFVLSCLCFCFIGWRCSPECCLKIILFLGPRFFEKFSGANFWVWEFVRGRCFWCCFCSPACCLNISFFLVSCFAGNFRERTLGIWHSCSFDVFWCCFCLCFCFIMWCCSPESCLKISPSLRSVFSGKFSGANFGYLALVLV